MGAEVRVRVRVGVSLRVRLRAGAAGWGAAGRACVAALSMALRTASRGKGWTATPLIPLAPGDAHPSASCQRPALQPAWLVGSPRSAARTKCCEAWGGIGTECCELTPNPNPNLGRDRDRVLRGLPPPHAQPQAPTAAPTPARTPAHWRLRRYVPVAPGLAALSLSPFLPISPSPHLPISPSPYLPISPSPYLPIPIPVPIPNL